jgi:hypothetical protein
MPTTWIDVSFNIRAARIKAAKIPCPCICLNTKDRFVINANILAADTVSGVPRWQEQESCGPMNSTFYWWDCYTANEEGGREDFGWTSISGNYVKKAAPHFRDWTWLGEYASSDPNTLAIASIVIYEKCVNGYLETRKKTSNILWFFWRDGHWEL